MIKVTTLNNVEFVINADLIEMVEKTPDSVITLFNGKKVVVLESVEEIIQRVIVYRKSIGFACLPSVPGSVQQE